MQPLKSWLFVLNACAVFSSLYKERGIYRPEIFIFKVRLAVSASFFSVATCSHHHFLTTIERSFWIAQVLSLVTIEIRQCWPQSAMQLLLQRSYMLMNEVHISSASVDVPLEDSTSWKCYAYFARQCTQNAI